MLDFSFPPLICTSVCANGMQQWFEACQRAAQFSTSAEEVALFWNPRQFRQDWFAGLNEMADSYMRSPLFMQWMQSYLKAITQPVVLFSAPLGGGHK